MLAFQGDQAEPIVLSTLPPGPDDPVRAFAGSDTGVGTWTTRQVRETLSSRRLVARDAATGTLREWRDRTPLGRTTSRGMFVGRTTDTTYLLLDLPTGVERLYEEPNLQSLGFRATPGGQSYVLGRSLVSPPGAATPVYAPAIALY